MGIEFDAQVASERLKDLCIKNDAQLQAMKARAFYETRAKDLIKELRETRQMTYADLALKLKAYGLPISERVLINRINRGSFSFAFAMIVMDALAVEVLELPKQEAMYPVGHRPDQALTKADLKRRTPNNQGN